MDQILRSSSLALDKNEHTHEDVLTSGLLWLFKTLTVPKIKRVLILSNESSISGSLGEGYFPPKIRLTCIMNLIYLIYF